MVKAESRALPLFNAVMIAWGGDTPPDMGGGDIIPATRNRSESAGILDEPAISAGKESGCFLKGSDQRATMDNAMKRTKMNRTKKKMNAKWKLKLNI